MNSLLDFFKVEVLRSNIQKGHNLEIGYLTSIALYVFQINHELYFPQIISDFRFAKELLSFRISQ